MTSYSDFVASKLTRSPPTGIEGAVVTDESLFGFQQAIVQWALRRGRAAIFADTGLGKSRMQLTWSAYTTTHTRKPCLILAPLAVAAQTRSEGARIGVDACVVKDGSEVDATSSRIYITNYDRLHRFDPSVFGSVVWDESSIFKSFNSKTLTQCIEAFASTPFRLACTATPSPNDYTELGTHAEILGICSRVEMLSEFFVHDGGDTQSWRLKGHARKAFWQFVATWAALVRSPADLGYDASAYKLPPLNIEHHMIAADEQSVRESGMLFAQEAKSLMERKTARRGSVAARVAKCVELVNASAEQFVVWCDLNAESDALAAGIEGAVEVRGSMDNDEKEEALRKFAAGEARVIVSKPSITGFGLNWQFSRNMAFVGVTDSWESYYQAVRRQYRFGQKLPVNVHIFASELEGAVVANLQRKERDAAIMAEELAAETAAIVRAEVRGSTRATNDYAASAPMCLPQWIGGEL